MENGLPDKGSSGEVKLSFFKSTKSIILPFTDVLGRINSSCMLTSGR